jgi:hypothetical protein
MNEDVFNGSIRKFLKTLGERPTRDRKSCPAEFCRSKSCANLMASTIRRSGLMRNKRRRGNRLGERSDVLFVPGMGRMAK